MFSDYCGMYHAIFTQSKFSLNIKPDLCYYKTSLNIKALTEVLHCSYFSECQKILLVMLCLDSWSHIFHPGKCYSLRVISLRLVPNQQD